MQLIPEIFTAMQTSRLLFLYLGQPEQGERLERCLDEEVAHREHADRSRVVVRTIEAQNLTGMRLPVDTQPLVVDAIVDWMDQTLPESHARVVADRAV
jgi:hypothetical protein